MHTITREDLVQNLWRLNTDPLKPNDPMTLLLDNIKPETMQAILDDMDGKIRLAKDSKRLEVYKSLKDIVKDLPADDPMRIAVEGFEPAPK